MFCRDQSCRALTPAPSAGTGRGCCRAGSKQARSIPESCVRLTGPDDQRRQSGITGTKSVGSCCIQVPEEGFVEKEGTFVSIIEYTLGLENINAYTGVVNRLATHNRVLPEYPISLLEAVNVGYWALRQ